MAKQAIGGKYLMLGNQRSIFKRNRFTQKGLQLWVDASLPGTITKDGSNKVSVWKDKTINARNFTQSTAAQQPQYLATGINGLGAVYFDGTAYNMPFSDPTLAYIASSSFTIVYVATKTAGTANQYVIGGQGTGTRNNLIAGYVSSNTYKFGLGNDDMNAIVNVVNAGVPELYLMTFDGSTFERRIRRNTADEGLGAASGALSGMSGQALGKYLSAFGSFALGELLIYNRVLTASEISGVERDMMSKWSITYGS
jgi:hypothetical protein